MPREDAGRRAELVRTAEMRVALRRLLRRTEELADAEGVTLLDAMHYGMEKPPQLAMAEWFRRQGLTAEFVPDGPK